jgi:phosphoglycolate phosphatase-like HAD superfamily hydrolase
MNKQKLIIWDFDGPIVDSRQLALELTQYQYHDVDEHTHRNLFNGNIFSELSKLKKKEVSEDEYAQFLEKSYWPRKMILAPVPGIQEILKDLDGEFKMVINSSSSTSQISNYLANNNLAHLFSKIYGNEIKSKEEKFKLILKDFNIQAKDCIFVTDTLGDVIEAETLAIPSIVILWGYQLKEHFSSVEDKVVFVENVTNLPQIVRKYFSV